MAAKVVSIINLKGGVGKSTITMILAEFLAYRAGKRVLVIDMDAQANLSYCMVPEGSIQNQERKGRTVYHLFRNALHGSKNDVSDLITQPPLVVSNISRNAMMLPGTNLHMIVSSPSVAELDEDLLKLWEDGKPMPADLRRAVSDVLEPVRDIYEYILIDCPPGLSLFSSSALIASDYFLCPVIPEPLSLQGVDLILNRARELKDRNQASQLEFMGVVLNIVKHYRTTHARVANHLYSGGKAQYQPFKHWLPDNERLRKLGEFDPDLEGDWAGGESHKFATLHSKYSLSYRLANPKTGLLSLADSEGEKYRLEERLQGLVEEFEEKCV